jgi:hypothetical protein
VSDPVDAFERVSATLGASAAGVRTLIERRARGGTVDLSYADIADATNLSKRQVQRIVDALVADGWLTRSQQVGRRGSLLANRYGVSIPMDIPMDTPIDVPMDTPIDRPPTPPVVVVDKKNINGNGHAADFRPTWAESLGERYRKVQTKFGRLSVEFTDGMFRALLIDAERDVGRVAEPVLMSGLQSAFAALERQMLAERGGSAKPIGNLKPYAKRILVDKIREATP